MGALIHRLRTGKGQYIEVPMFETMVAFVMPEHMAGRAFEPPMGEAGYARVINKDRRPFQTKDGWLCVLPYTTQQWLRFLRMIGRDDTADQPELADTGSPTPPYGEDGSDGTRGWQGGERRCESQWDPWQ